MWVLLVIFIFPAVVLSESSVEYSYEYYDYDDPVQTEVHKNFKEYLINMLLNNSSAPAPSQERDHAVESKKPLHHKHPSHHRIHHSGKKHHGNDSHHHKHHSRKKHHGVPADKIGSNLEPIVETLGKGSIIGAQNINKDTNKDKDHTETNSIKLIKESETPETTNVKPDSNSFNTQVGTDKLSKSTDPTVNPGTIPIPPDSEREIKNLETIVSSVSNSTNYLNPEISTTSPKPAHMNRESLSTSPGIISVTPGSINRNSEPVHGDSGGTLKNQETTENNRDITLMNPEANKVSPERSSNHPDPRLEPSTTPKNPDITYAITESTPNNTDTVHISSASAQLRPESTISDTVQGISGIKHNKNETPLLSSESMSKNFETTQVSSDRARNNPAPIHVTSEGTLKTPDGIHLSPERMPNNSEIIDVSPGRIYNISETVTARSGDKFNNPENTQVGHGSELNNAEPVRVILESTLQNPDTTHMTPVSTINSPEPTHLSPVSIINNPEPTHLSPVSIINNPDPTHVNPGRDLVTSHVGSDNAHNNPEYTHVSLWTLPKTPSTTQVIPSNVPKNPEINHVSAVVDPEPFHVSSGNKVTATETPRVPLNHGNKVVIPERYPEISATTLNYRKHTLATPDSTQQSLATSFITPGYKAVEDYVKNLTGSIRNTMTPSVKYENAISRLIGALHNSRQKLRESHRKHLDLDPIIHPSRKKINLRSILFKNRSSVKKYPPKEYKPEVSEVNSNTSSVNCPYSDCELNPLVGNVSGKLHASANTLNQNPNSNTVDSISSKKQDKDLNLIFEAKNGLENARRELQPKDKIPLSEPTTDDKKINSFSKDSLDFNNKNNKPPISTKAEYLTNLTNGGIEENNLGVGGANSNSSLVNLYNISYESRSLSSNVSGKLKASGNTVNKNPNSITLDNISSQKQDKDLNFISDAKNGLENVRKELQHKDKILPLSESTTDNKQINSFSKRSLDLDNKNNIPPISTEEKYPTNSTNEDIESKIKSIMKFIMKDIKPVGGKYIYTPSNKTMIPDTSDFDYSVPHELHNLTNHLIKVISKNLYGKTIKRRKIKRQKRKKSEGQDNTNTKSINYDKNQEKSQTLTDSVSSNVTVQNGGDSSLDATRTVLRDNKSQFKNSNVHPLKELIHHMAHLHITNGKRRKDGKRRKVRKRKVKKQKKQKVPPGNTNKQNITTNSEIEQNNKSNNLDKITPEQKNTPGATFEAFSSHSKKEPYPVVPSSSQDTIKNETTINNQDKNVDILPFSEKDILTIYNNGSQTVLSPTTELNRSNENHPYMSNTVNIAYVPGNEVNRPNGKNQPYPDNTEYITEVSETKIGNTTKPKIKTSSENKQSNIDSNNSEKIISEQRNTPGTTFEGITNHSIKEPSPILPSITQDTIKNETTIINNPDKYATILPFSDKDNVSIYNNRSLVKIVPTAEPNRSNENRPYTPNITNVTYVPGNKVNRPADKKQPYPELKDTSETKRGNTTKPKIKTSFESNKNNVKSTNSNEIISEQEKGSRPTFEPFTNLSKSGSYQVLPSSTRDTVKTETTIINRDKNVDILPLSDKDILSIYNNGTQNVIVPTAEVNTSNENYPDMYAINVTNESGNEVNRPTDKNQPYPEHTEYINKISETGSGNVTNPSSESKQSNIESNNRDKIISEQQNTPGPSFEAFTKHSKKEPYPGFPSSIQDITKNETTINNQDKNANIVPFSEKDILSIHNNGSQTVIPPTVELDRSDEKHPFISNIVNVTDAPGNEVTGPMNNTNYNYLPFFEKPSQKDFNKTDKSKPCIENAEIINKASDSGNPHLNLTPDNIINITENFKIDPSKDANQFNRSVSEEMVPSLCIKIGKACIASSQNKIILDDINKTKVIYEDKSNPTKLENSPSQDNIKSFQNGTPFLLVNYFLSKINNLTFRSEEKTIEKESKSHPKIEKPFSPSYNGGPKTVIIIM